jgi:hypothetical protein
MAVRLNPGITSVGTPSFDTLSQKDIDEEIIGSELFSLHPSQLLPGVAKFIPYWSQKVVSMRVKKVCILYFLPVTCTVFSLYL